MPVVDKEGRLVGIVTIDDAIDVMEEEADNQCHHDGHIGIVHQPAVHRQELDEVGRGQQGPADHRHPARRMWHRI